MISAYPSGYSAKVEMLLHLPCGETLPIAQCGPDFMILFEEFERAPSEAVIFIDVDGEQQNLNVILAEGIKSRRVGYFAATELGRLAHQELSR